MLILRVYYFNDLHRCLFRVAEENVIISSGGILNLRRHNGLCSLHRPLNVYATWGDIGYCLWRLQISNNTADGFNWRQRLRQRETPSSKWCRTEFGVLVPSFFHSWSVVGERERPFSRPIRSVMEAFLSRRTLGRIHGRRKRMDVDRQAAVGDQLTTDGGSAFGLRREGMVAWEALQPNAPLGRKRRLTTVGRGSRSATHNLSSTRLLKARRRKSKSNSTGVVQRAPVAPRHRFTRGFFGLFYAAIRRQNLVHSSARRSRAALQWWRLLVVRRVLDGPSSLWRPHCDLAASKRATCRYLWNPRQ